MLTEDDQDIDILSKKTPEDTWETIYDTPDPLDDDQLMTTIITPSPHDPLANSRTKPITHNDPAYPNLPSLQSKLNSLQSIVDSVLTHEHLDATPNKTIQPKIAAGVADTNGDKQTSRNPGALTHAEIRTTRLEFIVPPKENTREGIKTRLLSFIPTVVAKCQGLIHPWEQTSTLEPIRDIHKIINTQTMDKYFHYDITVGRRIRGWKRIQNSDPNQTFTSIKYKDNIVKKALNSFPMNWTQTALQTSESTTPLFLACVGRHINLTKLN